MDDIKQCRLCKRLFSYIGQPICPECVTKADDTFVKVRDYLYDHPHARLAEVCKEAKVEERTVLYLIKEDRVQFANTAGLEGKIKLRCTVCGKPVPSGRLCDSCQAKFAKSIESDEKIEAEKKQEKIEKAKQEEEKAKAKQRMYTQDLRSKK